MESLVDPLFDGELEVQRAAYGPNLNEKYLRKNKTSEKRMGTVNKMRTLAAISMAMAATGNRPLYNGNGRTDTNYRPKSATKHGVAEVNNEIAHAKAKLARHRGKGKTRKQRKESRNG